jgi:flavin reductase (DIM6/NTAB) family NADH-FMN oxidoreductase RutF
VKRGDALYYEPGVTHHGLARDPFKSCVVPRPIGWISTIGSNGVHNLAPFSQFQNVSYDPPYVMMSMSQRPGGGRKDTATNIESGREFVWNMATYDLREAVVASGEHVAPDVDEFDLAGVTKAPSRLVRPCRVAESPVQFECVWYNTMRLPMGDSQDSMDLIIGRVVAVHVHDDYITADGKIDILKIRPLARLGYMDYTSVESTFELRPPTGKYSLGQEGAASKIRELSSRHI